MPARRCSASEDCLFCDLQMQSSSSSLLLSLLYHNYGGRIGTRMRSIKWCHFQWSERTLTNPVFMVTPFFDADSRWISHKQLHIWPCRRRIGKRTQAFYGISFNDLESPQRQILRSRYYSTSNNTKMVQNRAIVTMTDHYRKSYMIHRTFNDPKLRFWIRDWGICNL